MNVPRHHQSTSVPYSALANTSGATIPKERIVSTHSFLHEWYEASSPKYSGVPQNVVALTNRPFVAAVMYNTNRETSLYSGIHGRGTGNPFLKGQSRSALHVLFCEKGSVRRICKQVLPDLNFLLKYFLASNLDKLFLA